MKMRLAIEADFSYASSENLSHIRRAKLSYVIQYTPCWTCTALWPRHTQNQKLQAKQPREGGGQKVGQRQAALRWPLWMWQSRKACTLPHIPHAMGAPRRTTRKSIRRIGIFNINHTEHTERGGGTKWDTVRSDQEQQQTRNCCHELSCLSSAELPSGFWGHYLTLISICNTCLARCRCPQLECYWWVTALTKHHHHSSYVERGGRRGAYLALLCWHF